MTFVEKYKIVEASPIATTNGGITCDYISVKHAHRVTIIASFLQAASEVLTTLGVNEATAVDGTGATAVTAVQKVWKNANTSTTDTLVQATDAATLVVTTGANNQQIVMEFDPATLSAGFDCIAATVVSSGEATNFASIIYIIETRYPQATPPAAITD